MDPSSGTLGAGVLSSSDPSSAFCSGPQSNALWLAPIVGGAGVIGSLLNQMYYANKKDPSSSSIESDSSQEGTDKQPSSVESESALEPSSSADPSTIEPSATDTEPSPSLPSTIEPHEIVIEPPRPSLFARIRSVGSRCIGSIQRWWGGSSKQGDSSSSIESNAIEEGGNIERDSSVETEPDKEEAPTELESALEPSSSAVPSTIEPSATDTEPSLSLFKRIANAGSRCISSIQQWWRRPSSTEKSQETSGESRIQAIQYSPEETSQRLIKAIFRNFPINRDLQGKQKGTFFYCLEKLTPRCLRASLAPKVLSKEQAKVIQCGERVLGEILKETPPVMTSTEVEQANISDPPCEADLIHSIKEKMALVCNDLEIHGALYALATLCLPADQTTGLHAEVMQLIQSAQAGHTHWNGVQLEREAADCPAAQERFPEDTPLEARYLALFDHWMQHKGVGRMRRLGTQIIGDLVIQLAHNLVSAEAQKLTTLLERLPTIEGSQHLVQLLAGALHNTAKGTQEYLDKIRAFAEGGAETLADANNVPLREWLNELASLHLFDVGNEGHALEAVAIEKLAEERLKACPIRIATNRAYWWIPIPTHLSTLRQITRWLFRSIQPILAFLLLPITLFLEFVLQKWLRKQGIQKLKEVGCVQNLLQVVQEYFKPKTSGDACTPQSSAAQLQYSMKLLLSDACLQIANQANTMVARLLPYESTSPHPVTREEEDAQLQELHARVVAPPKVTKKMQEDFQAVLRNILRAARLAEFEEDNTAEMIRCLNAEEAVIDEELEQAIKDLLPEIRAPEELETLILSKSNQILSLLLEALHTHPHLRLQPIVGLLDSIHTMYDPKATEPTEMEQNNATTTLTHHVEYMQSQVGEWIAQLMIRSDEPQVRSALSAHLLLRRKFVESDAVQQAAQEEIFTREDRRTIWNDALTSIDTQMKEIQDWRLQEDWETHLALTRETHLPPNDRAQEDWEAHFDAMSKEYQDLLSRDGGVGRVRDAFTLLLIADHLVEARNTWSTRSIGLGTQATWYPARQHLEKEINGLIDLRDQLDRLHTVVSNDPKLELNKKRKAQDFITKARASTNELVGSLRTYENSFVLLAQERANAVVGALVEEWLLQENKVPDTRIALAERIKGILGEQSTNLAKRTLTWLSPPASKSKKRATSTKTPEEEWKELLVSAGFTRENLQTLSKKAQEELDSLESKRTACNAALSGAQDAILKVFQRDSSKEFAPEVRALASDSITAYQNRIKGLESQLSALTPARIYRDAMLPEWAQRLCQNVANDVFTTAEGNDAALTQLRSVITTLVRGVVRRYGERVMEGLLKVAGSEHLLTLTVSAGMEAVLNQMVGDPPHTA